jgi:hypothetical protein
MMADPLLDHDDVHRWRACARRFWLHRHRPDIRTAAAALTDTLANPDADPSAEAAVVHGPAPRGALRASFPRALAIDVPDTPAGWALAVQRTAAALSERGAQGEDWAIFGACLAGVDGARARIVGPCGNTLWPAGAKCRPVAGGHRIHLSLPWLLRRAVS